MDRDRIGRAGQEFRSIINDPLMANSAILVFANKQVGGWVCVCVCVCVCVLRAVTILVASS
jgi:hypothetical protein